VAKSWLQALGLHPSITGKRENKIPSRTTVQHLSSYVAVGFSGRNFIWKGDNEARGQASEASADRSDFPPMLELALPSREGTSTSSPHLSMRLSRSFSLFAQTEKIISRLIQMLIAAIIHLGGEDVKERKTNGALINAQHAGLYNDLTFLAVDVQENT